MNTHRKENRKENLNFIVTICKDRFKLSGLILENKGCVPCNEKIARNSSQEAQF